MVDYAQRMEEAKKSLVTAHHMLTQTLPLLKENKIMVSVVIHLYQAYQAAIESVLLYEKANHNVGAFHKSFPVALNLFRIKCAKKYDINVAQLTNVEKIIEIYAAHKQSPVEFPKGEKFVICDDDYTSLKTLNAASLREQVNDAKVFIERLASKITYAAGRSGPRRHAATSTGRTRTQAD